MTGTAQDRQSVATSRRIEPFAASVWPWVDQMAERNPEAVFFGGGVPPTEAIPVARLRAGADRAWADGAETLLYGEVRGYRPLRELIVERMAARGAIVDPADVLITNGAQQGIDLAARIFIDPGDFVLTEEPTFMDALRVFRSHEAEPVGVPVDEEGLQVDALATLLDRLPKRPKFLYTMPTYQNPMGVSMSAARRRALVDLARERGLAIVEDDPYGELSYDGGFATDTEIARSGCHLPRHLLQGAGAGVARRVGGIITAAARGILQCQRGDGHPQRADHDADRLPLRAGFSR